MKIKLYNDDIPSNINLGSKIAIDTETMGLNPLRDKLCLIQLSKGNAENMNFESNSMQGITCVFLLHELPRKARQNVINECLRILEPGGTFILADSIQTSDSPKFQAVMDNFHKVFHEPFYYDYTQDDIESRLIESGFESITTDSHFMTKVWSCKKPEQS